MDGHLLGLADVPEGRSKTLWGARGRGPAVRRRREFTPEEKKDTIYWEKRRKNNEAAKRSREKRRLNDAATEGRLAALLKENSLLRAELRALKLHFGVLPPVGGHRILPLQALLWGSPWTGDPHPGAEPLPPLPRSHGCLLKPCSLDSGVPGCRSCMAAHKWMSLATSPRPSQEPTPHGPKRIDLALQAALPAALLSYHLVDEHVGSRPELSPCWGCHGSEPSEVQLTPAADFKGLSPRVACPSPEGMGQPSLPHKLRIKSQASARVLQAWGGGRGPL
ncbi:NFIL3 like protein [Orycteropus afer afer]|uniref:NFIL3 like protein n=1 Tax=Orycteropus afer afer TaxID=1230840 RepID=A0AC54Z682_ORYAF|nr:NFIL3 like protein [Orycteropus afer afer]